MEIKKHLEKHAVLVLLIATLITLLLLIPARGNPIISVILGVFSCICYTLSMFFHQIEDMEK